VKGKYPVIAHMPVVIAFLAFAAGGCSKEEPQTPAKKVHDHSGWWCEEHGIPEHLCSMCSEKVAAECKKKGDWCKKHDRALSQCFICNPKRKAYYAEMYRQRYGKEPPPIEEK